MLGGFFCLFCSAFYFGFCRSPFLEEITLLLCITVFQSGNLVFFNSKKVIYFKSC